MMRVLLAAAAVTALAGSAFGQNALPPHLNTPPGGLPLAPTAEPAPVNTAPSTEPASAAPAQAAARPAQPRRRPAPPPPPRVTAISTDPLPSFGPQTVAATQMALERYRRIQAAGGWPTLPPATRLATGATSPDVQILHQRLAAEGDLAPGFVGGLRFDANTAEAVARFQRRVGLVPSGIVAGATVRQLNIPIAARITALEKSLERLADSRFQFGPRYVVVNIPATASESIENGIVRRRHVVIVGKPDRASPMVETRLTVVNFNPTWTIPTSIIRRDIIPKMRRNPNTLAQMRVRVLDSRGTEVDPRAIDWSTERAVNFTLRQDPGAGNSLGRVRIDMPNREAVFMHDTPSRRLFNADQRFLSSGCVRVADVSDFVAWLLEPQGFSRDQVNAGMNGTERRDVRLRQAVPVAWVYMTGWASAEGVVSFRDDIYGWDAPGAPAQRVVRAPERVPTPEPMPVSQPAPPPQPQRTGLFDGFFGATAAQTPQRLEDLPAYMRN